MWPFRKRLTDEQKDSLVRVVGQLNTLTRDQEAAFAAVLSEMTEFLLQCNKARNSGLGRPFPPIDDDHIATVRERLVVYRTAIGPAISRLEGIVIPEWAPSKLVRRRQEAVGFWRTHSQFLDTALEGLEPPDPLVDQEAKAKLNMFVSGIGLGLRMVKHHEFKL